MINEALKLADELDALHQYVPSEAPAMIRRLVEELDKQGEPVAWMSPDGKVSQTEGKLFYIPLYTTPQTKPLSDDEILHIYSESCRNTLMGIDPLIFAREILRKAQEK